ncbi:MAG TPA: alkaline phosphatase family protein [Candidatus Sulfotelmatobacter sp.]|nr:alkaline phosphatase family protein [Candidatus Sulfotelmatobacter sp.]
MRLPAALAVLALAATASVPSLAAGGPTPDDLAVPRYRHIFVIVDENKDADQIVGAADAPGLSALASRYGTASAMYAEVHPSEPNYVAMLSGSTFGLHDDDAYYCKPGTDDPHCHGTNDPGYAPHLIDAPNLATQLTGAGLTWKGYYESIPATGSLAVTGASETDAPPWYVSKHAGFINFRSVVADPRRNEHLVGLDALQADLDAGTAPSFGYIVGNLCDDMHGMSAGANVPADCTFDPIGPLIRRGDNWAVNVVNTIIGSPLWASGDNVAIVVTWDESDSPARDGCCGVTPNAVSNFGGGRIPTIVITNHGPRGVVDATPYNHYSLLRTIEDAFGIHQYLGLAAASDRGVKPMLPLFRTP